MIAPPVSGNPAGPVRDRAEGKCGIAVRVIRDLNELSEIRSIWENWQSHPNTDLDFYQTILRVRADIVRPHVMVVYGGGRPIALLAGRIEDKRVRFRAGYLTLLRPKLRLLTLPFGGFIGDATAQTAESVVREVIRSLRRGEADMAVFEPVDTRSALHEEVLNRVSWLCRDYLHTSQVHRTMTLQNSAELFQQSLSPKVRKNLKWQAKKILEDYGGAVEIRCHRSTADVETLIRDVEAIAKKTYQRGLGVGFSDSVETRERMLLEAGKGWLRGYVLYIQGTPAAFWLGTIYQGVFHSNFMGYDPAFAKHSPGMHLATQVIGEFCNAKGADGLTMIDFGLGDAQYKQVLGTSLTQESGLCITAPTVKGVFLNLLRTSLGLCDRLARRVLAQSNLLNRLKTGWRHRLRGRS